MYHRVAGSKISEGKLRAWCSSPVGTRWSKTYSISHFVYLGHTLYLIMYTHSYLWIRVIIKLRSVFSNKKSSWTLRATVRRSASQDSFRLKDAGQCTVREDPCLMCHCPPKRAEAYFPHHVAPRGSSRRAGLRAQWCQSPRQVPAAFCWPQGTDGQQVTGQRQAGCCKTIESKGGKQEAAWCGGLLLLHLPYHFQKATNASLTSQLPRLDTWDYLIWGGAIFLEIKGLCLTPTQSYPVPTWRWQLSSVFLSPVLSKPFT